MKSRIVLSAGILLSLLPSLSGGSAHARGTGSYRHLLSVSESVAHPSYSALAGRQNPGGLVFNKGAQLHLDFQSADTELTSPDFGGDLLFGGSSWGGGVGVDYLTDGVAGGDGQIANYGLAAYLQGLQTAFGISGHTGINGVEGTSIDLGILIGPFENVTVGVTTYGVTGGIDDLGAGVDVMLGRGFSFVADLLTDTSFDRMHLKPGIWVGSQTAGLTVSYGFDLTGSGNGNGNGGGGGDLSVGANVVLARKFNWQIYYQQFNKLYTGLSFSL